MHFRRMINLTERPVIAQYHLGYYTDLYKTINYLIDSGADGIAVADWFGGHDILTMAQEELDCVVDVCSGKGIPTLLKTRFRPEHGWRFRQRYIRREAERGFDSFLILPGKFKHSLTEAMVNEVKEMGMKPVWEFRTYQKYKKWLPYLSIDETVLVTQRNLNGGETDPNGIYNFMSALPKVERPWQAFIGGSGITSVQQANQAFRNGCDAVIIGHHFMRNLYGVEDFIKKVKE